MNQDEILTLLLEGWLDETPGPEEQAALLAELEADAGLRRRFADQLAVMGGLRASADQHPRWLALFDLFPEADNHPRHLVSFEASTMGRIRGTSKPSSASKTPAIWASAAAVALSVATLFLVNGGKIVERPVAKGFSAPVAAPVAICVGREGTTRHVQGATLLSGMISQHQGWMTLQMLNGVLITLEAPYQVELLAVDRIRMVQGSARVRVPDGARGFALESGLFEIIDLGTEFAIRLSGDGKGTCRVFEGAVDVSLLDSMGGVRNHCKLARRQSLSIDPAENALEIIQEEDDSYPSFRQPPREKLRLPERYPQRVRGMNPIAYWRFESLGDNRIIPNESEHGKIRLRAIGSAALSEEAGGNHAGDLSVRSSRSFFQIPTHAAGLFRGDFTIAMFVQWDLLHNAALLSAMRYDESARGHALVFQSYASNRRLSTNGPVLHALVRQPTGWVAGREISAPTVIQPLVWHHVALVRRGEEGIIHLDGRVVARGPVEGGPLDATHVFFGRLNANPTQSGTEARELCGRIDELALFTRALSHEEIIETGKRMPQR